eukprot:gene6895-30873_t
MGGGRCSSGAVHASAQNRVAKRITATWSITRRTTRCVVLLGWQPGGSALRRGLKLIGAGRQQRCSQDQQGQGRERLRVAQCLLRAQGPSSREWRTILGRRRCSSCSRSVPGSDAIPGRNPRRFTIFTSPHVLNFSLILHSLAHFSAWSLKKEARSGNLNPLRPTLLCSTLLFPAFTSPTNKLVDMTSVFRRQSGRANRDNSAVYISPGSNGGTDFIPAFKGPGNSESIRVEADARDLGNRIAAGSKVFGNPMFMDGSDNDHSAKETPSGFVKGNSFFDDSKNSARDLSMTESLKATPDKGHLRGAAGMNGSPRHSSTLARRSAFASNEDEDNHSMPVVARAIPRSVTSANKKNTQSVSAWETELKQMIGSKNRLEAIFRTAPSEGLVKCYLKRVKNFFGTHCSFQMHLESGDVFLLAARRRKKSKVSSYVISQNIEDLKRDSDNCISKLKSSFGGTEYMLWGKSADPCVRKGYADEQLCISFRQASIKASNGPRTMSTLSPQPETNWKPGSAPDGRDSLSNCMDQTLRHELSPAYDRKLSMLATKAPEYDEKLKGYTLDFKGRVKEASVKNFQLVHWDHVSDQRGSGVALQFGKIADDVYALDFQYPMNIHLAFSIALASIDTKLCYSY